MAAELHIAIKPETLFEVAGIPITNTLFTSFLVSIFIALFALWANRQLKSVDKPGKAQAFVEMLVEGVYGLVHGIAGARTWTFMPLVMSFMFFILLNNWSEQLPGFHTIKYTGESRIELKNIPGVSQAHAASSEETAEGGEEEHHAVALFRGAHADLNMTLAVALISVGATQYFGLKFAKFDYVKKFFNISSPIALFIGVLELLGEFSKILSFSFRLFGNIFAGEVLIAVISFLVPAVVPMPLIVFELFVGALQAYVFAMLSTVFFSMAADHHDH